MKKFLQIFLRVPGSVAACVALASIALAMLACGPNATIGGEEVSSIRIVGDDGRSGDALSREDTKALAGFFSEAKYDSLLNDGGIMVKMVEPDYTLAILYVGQGSKEDMMQIWIDSGRVHFRSKWYFLRKEDLPEAVVILKNAR